MHHPPPSEPPRLFRRFLLWFLSPELREEVDGDLLERYERKLQETSRTRARLDYAYQVVHYLRPFAVRGSIFSDLTSLLMVRNHYKLAWRNLRKNRLYTLLNLSGLTLGLTCFIAAALYVQYEFSYDRQHENAERIHRVARLQQGNSFKGSNRFAVTPPALTPALRSEFPEVEAATTIRPERILLSYEAQTTYEYGLFADSSFLEIFTYPALAGDARSAITDPGAILLTASLAKRYFGTENALGKTISFGNDRLLTVKAVLADPPANQHFTFSFLTVLGNHPGYVEDRASWPWSSNSYWSYLVLPPDYDPARLDTKLGTLGRLAAASEELSTAPEFFLQPLTDIHLHSHLNMEISNNGNIRYVYFAISIGFIVLLLALFNYVNLAIGRTSLRLREVGTRKVMGARRGQIIVQFVVESTLIVLLSFVAAVLLCVWLLPRFNQFLELDISIATGTGFTYLLWLLSISFLLSIGAGIYPALISSGFSPVKALQGRLGATSTGRGLRNSLVIGQFVVAVILGVGSVIIYQQLQFISNKKLGYNREEMVYIPYERQDVLDKLETFRAELTRHPDVSKVALSNTLPLNSGSRGRLRKWEGKGTEDDLKIYRNRVDYDFLEVFEMELVAGRNFSRAFPADTSSSYLLNESAVAALGWDDPIGKSLEDGRVIGVVRDFHFQPLDLEIQPLYLKFLDDENLYYQGYFTIKVNTSNLTTTLAHIEETLSSIYPRVPFDYQFLDESYDRLYHTERSLAKAFGIFTGIALLLACLGLFGLVTLSVMTRRKEIGIRKVMGASALSILSLIAKDYLRLILLAFLIAIPTAWWIMNSWLERFAYRIEIAGWVFAAVGGATLAIALCTLISQSISTALANPATIVSNN